MPCFPSFSEERDYIKIKLKPKENEHRKSSQQIRKRSDSPPRDDVSDNERSAPPPPHINFLFVQPTSEH